ncbi:MAG TPA: hypothetical protein VFR34_06920 [Paracoccaceae bacterium]|nr:hypothetical protein [Paracoccaceae bacterium]
MLTIIITLVAGAVGGFVVGYASKSLSVGTIGNVIAGLIGGGALGQIWPMIMGGEAEAPAVTTTAPAATDATGTATTTAPAAADAAAAMAAEPMTTIAAVIVGLVGGAVLTAVAGLVKSQMAKS